MGQPKLLLPWHTQTVVGQSLAAALRSPVSSVVVVTGFESEAVASACQQTVATFAGHPLPTLSLIHNPRWSEGMATSLQVGLAQLPDPVDGFFVALGDMPLVSPTVYALLLHALAKEPDRVHIPVWEGKRGHPVLIPGSLLAEAQNEMRVVMQQTAFPDIGLRGLLGQQAARVREDSVSCPGVTIDLDTPAEYARYAPH